MPDTRWLKWDGVYWKDEGKCNWSEPAALERSTAPIELSRLDKQSKEQSALSGTINTPPGLAVRVVSVPNDFTPFEELGWVEVRFEALALVKCCLFRIYRFWSAEAPALPPEDLVYQEVLSGDQLRVLPIRAPGKNNREKLKKSAGDEIRRPGQYRGFIRRAEAKYKVRIWVSTEEDSFKEFVLDPEQRHRVLRMYSKEVERRKAGKGAYAFPKDQPDMFRLASFLDREDAELSEFKGAYDALRSSFDPKHRKGVTVHDQSETGAAWTEKDGAEINLMSEPCHEHRDYQVHLEKLPIQIESDAVTLYLDFCNRRKVQGENFSFPELGEFFNNVGRHLRAVEREFCCGLYCCLPKTVKDQFKETAELIRREFETLVAQKFPYSRSLIATQAFLAVIEWVLFYGRILPECWYYNVVPVDEAKPDYNSIPTPLNEARDMDQFKSLRQIQSSPVPFVAPEASLPKIWNFALGLRSRTRKECRKSKSPDEQYFDYWDFEILNRILKNDAVILAPSYNPLSEVFFCRTRSVPLYLAGVIDMAFITADKIRQTPVRFFEHDCFHVLDFTQAEEEKRDYQLHRGLAERFAELSPPRQPKNVYDQWQNNADKLLKEIEIIPDSKHKALVERLLFCIVHEPFNLSKSDARRPVVMEQKFLLMRLNDEEFIRGVVDRCSNRFFGKPLGEREAVENLIINARGYLKTAIKETTTDVV